MRPLMGYGYLTWELRQPVSDRLTAEEREPQRWIVITNDYFGASMIRLIDGLDPFG